MFGFNSMLFNTVEHIEVDMSVRLSGRGRLRAQANMEMTARAHLSGRGSLLARISRDIPMQAHLSGTGTLQPIIMTRDRYIGAHLSGRGTLRARANRYKVKYIAFTGEFRPGERIEIVMDKFKATKNGQNILNQITGDFFSLSPGSNEIVYTDSETQRRIRFRVSHSDRHL